MYQICSVEISKSQTVSTRRRIEFEREIRDSPEGDFSWEAIPLKQYTPAFLKWLVNSWDESKAEWNWKEEDWDSDITYIMRGHFLAKNKQDGSGFDIFGVKTVEEAKALAEPHIPREGIDIFINAFDAANYDRSQLPEPWQGEAQFEIDFPNMCASNLEFDIKEANDEYLILHIKNMDAAIAFGYGTSWCTAQEPRSDEGNYFDDYSDALIVICDQNGLRFQVHLAHEQFHNEADNSVDWMELCDDYPTLFQILIALQSSEALDDIEEHVRQTGRTLSVINSYYDDQKEALKQFANARLNHALKNQDSEKLCQVFNAISAIKIQDIRDNIWLSFDKKLIQQAIEIIPDIELSIEFFIDEYIPIGERGREYLAEAGLFSQYQEWILSQKQAELPKSIADALKLG